MSMYSIELKDIINEFELQIVTCEKKAEEIIISSVEINRPGLQLTGYMEHFGSERIQIAGMVEITYLQSLKQSERIKRLEELFHTGFPCLVVTRGLEVTQEMKTISEKQGIPILWTKEATSGFMSSLIRYLNLRLAPRISKHGVLVEVYGEGILILGESGVGKSETALELVKRGHRLVADDLVEIRKVSDKTLVGTAPDIIRHFIEIRGIGILDVKNLYGVGSVKQTENINLVVNFEFWDTKKEYDRLGITEEYTEILGLQVPSLTIPVRPGRNLAIVLEVAAMNNRQKKMGYNAAQAFNEKIFGETPPKEGLDA